MVENEICAMKGGKYGWKCQKKEGNDVLYNVIERYGHYVLFTLTDNRWH